MWLNKGYKMGVDQTMTNEKNGSVRRRASMWRKLGEQMLVTEMGKAF